MLPDRHVVGRHQAPDRILGVAEQRTSDRSLRRREQREKLSGGGCRQLFEEVGPVVRCHVVEQRGDVLLRHRAEQRFLRVEREVREHLGGVLARQDPEDDHLILDTELGQHGGDVGGVPIAHHVAQPREVSIAHDGGQLVRRSGHLADRGQRVLALRSRKLLLHLDEGGPDDVVVVDVRPDGLGGIAPQAMNQIEVGGGERRRVRTDVIRRGAAAVVVDDQAHLQVFGLLEALPRLAEEASLIVGRQARGLADVDLRRAEADDRGGDGIEDVVRWNDQQPHRPPMTLGQGDHVREELLLGRRRRHFGGLVVHIRAEQPDRHDDDITIAGSLERRRDVGQRVRMADAAPGRCPAARRPGGGERRWTTGAPARPAPPPARPRCYAPTS